MRYIAAILLLFAPAVDAQGAVQSASASDYLSAASVPVSAYPYSVMCYVQVNNTSNNRTIFGFEVDASNYHRSYVPPTSNAIGFGLAAGGTENFISTGSLSADTWQPVAVVATSATDRVVYAWTGLGGTRSSSSGTTSRAFPSSPTWKVCAAGASSQIRVQDITLVDVALNTTQLDEWAAGKTGPACSFSADIVGYQPLVSAVDESGYVGPSFSATGSPTWVAGPSLTGPSGSAVPVITHFQRIHEK